MQIFIKTLTGKTITIDYEAGDTVLQLKQKIQEKHPEINIGNQQLIFAGKPLQDDKRMDTTYPEIPKEGAVHLVINIKQLSDDTILNQLENDDVELLWTINYLGEKDQAFSYKTFQLTGSKELSTAFASFQKRHSQEAKGQVTYLSLTGVRKSALDECIKDEAPHKYQPDTGGMFTYTSADSEFFTQPLLVAVPKEEGFHIIQNPNSLVQHSAKYQNKLNDLYQMVYPPVASINVPSEISLQGVQNSVVANPPAIQDLGYNDLPLAFRQYLSSTSQDIRHKSGHISTEAYWNQLDNAKKNEINEIYKYIAAKPKPDAAPIGQSAFFQSDKKLSWNQLSFNEKAIISEQTQAIRIAFGGLSTLEYWEQIDISQQMELREQTELNNAVSNLDLH